MSSEVDPQQPASRTTGIQEPAVPRRRIRCKMCRQQLAGREQILRHGHDTTVPDSASESASEGAPKQAGANEHILTNSACSGYFVEPLKWMDHFLQNGETSGKITCPNQRCKAKLGNFDWVGVECGCKEWVIPGFCINRSKVDEVTIL